MATLSDSDTFDDDQLSPPAPTQEEEAREDEIMRVAEGSVHVALSKRLNEPELPPAADVARALGCDPDDYSSITWREDGQMIVLVPKLTAINITFTVSPGLGEGER